MRGCPHHRGEREDAALQAAAGDPLSESELRTALARLAAVEPAAVRLGEGEADGGGARAVDARISLAGCAAMNAHTWREACARAATPQSDYARLAVTRWYVEKWAPAMAYPYQSELWRNRTSQLDWAVNNSRAPLNEQVNYAGGFGADGKQRMSAEPSAEDVDAGRPSAERFSDEAAAAMHRAARAKAYGDSEPAPAPLTPHGIPHLFDCPSSHLPSPYTSDTATLRDPLRRPHIRLRALEDPKGAGLAVIGADGQAVAAFMEKREAAALSEKASREAYAMILLVAANLPGGCHMLRIGDGAHKPNPRDKTYGIATAWAVFRGGWPLPVPVTRATRSGHAPTPLPQAHWLHEGVAAYGGCLGPGANIASGEVAAMIGCLREAIHIRRTQAKDLVHFNVIYGTDSASCAHEVAQAWLRGNLSLIAKSANASLVETFWHLRAELHDLKGTFATVKLAPGPRRRVCHGGRRRLRQGLPRHAPQARAVESA